MGDGNLFFKEGLNTHNAYSEKKHTPCWAVVNSEDIFNCLLGRTDKVPEERTRCDHTVKDHFYVLLKRGKCVNGFLQD